MRFLVFPVVVLLAASLSAQTEEVEVQAASNVSVFGKTGSQSDFQTLVPGTKVKVDYTASHSEAIRAICNASSSSGSAWISSSGMVWRSDIVNNRFLPYLTATFLQSGTVSGDGTGALSSSASNNNPQPGPQSFLAIFRGPSSLLGNVRIYWEGRTQTTGSKTGAAVDVGNDNSVEFTGDAAKSHREERFFPVSFASGPVVVKVTFTGNAVTPGQGVQAFWQRLTVNMIKSGSCAIKSFGSPCKSAKLDGGMLTIGKKSILSLKMTGAPANAFFVRVVGQTRVNALLPGGCTLLASPEVVELKQSNSNGEFVEAFTLPGDTNWNLVFQYIPFILVNSQLQLSATNGQEATCSGF